MIDISTHDFSVPIPFLELSDELHALAEDEKFDGMLPSVLIRFVQDAIHAAYEQGWRARNSSAELFEEQTNDAHASNMAEMLAEVRELNGRLDELRKVIKVFSERA